MYKIIYGLIGLILSLSTTNTFNQFLLTLSENESDQAISKGFAVVLQIGGIVLSYVMMMVYTVWVLRNKDSRKLEKYFNGVVLAGLILTVMSGGGLTSSFLINVGIDPHWAFRFIWFILLCVNIFFVSSQKKRAS